MLLPPRLGPLWLSALLLATFQTACSRESSRREPLPDPRANAPETPSTDSNSTSAPDAAARQSDATPTGSAPPAEEPVDPLEEKLRRYASWLEESDAPACDERYGIRLNVTWPSQHSRLKWLAALLTSEPDLARLIEANQRVRLIQPMYGDRNYGRAFNTSDISRLALAVECREPRDCRAVAGFYARVDPFASIQSYCGTFPGRTGGDYPLDLESLPAQLRGYPHAVCARLRACSAAGNLPPPSCDGLALDSQRCLQAATCEQALECFARVPPDPARKLWSDDPGHTSY